MKYTIYHNPRCGKSREALSFLQENGVAVEVVEYLKTNPSQKEMEEILKKLGIPAFELIRKDESIFKENFKGKNLSEKEWVKILCEHPILIQRPIVIKGNKAVVARPLENIEGLER